MNENIKKFYEALAKDEAMRNKAEAMEAKEGVKADKNAAAEAAVCFAKSEGFEFTAAELLEYNKKANELSGEELEAVAGGGGPSVGASICLFSFGITTGWNF